MEIKLIEIALMLICGLIFLFGVAKPLMKLTIAFFTYLIRLVFPLLEKSDLEKQKIALETARQRVRIAEIQKETVQTEKKAMKIQESIIDEEFEGLEELDEKKYFGTKN